MAQETSVAGSYEQVDELSGSGAMKLVSWLSLYC
jgi:hypothetical protein